MKCIHGVDHTEKSCDICYNAGVRVPQEPLGKPATVHQFTGITSLNHEPDWILEKAKGRLKQVLVVGYDEEDGSFFFSGSHSDGPENLWLLAVAQKKLIDIVEG